MRRRNVGRRGGLALCVKMLYSLLIFASEGEMLR